MIEWVDEVESGRKVYKAYETFIREPKYKGQEKESILEYEGGVFVT